MKVVLHLGHSVRANPVAPLQFLRSLKDDCNDLALVFEEKNEYGGFGLGFFQYEY